MGTIKDICKIDPQFKKKLDEFLISKVPDLPKAERAVLAYQLVGTPFPPEYPLEICVKVITEAIEATPGYKIDIVSENEKIPDDTLRWAKQDIVQDRFGYLLDFATRVFKKDNS